MKMRRWIIHLRIFLLSLSRVVFIVFGDVFYNDVEYFRLSIIKEIVHCYNSLKVARV